MTSTNYYGTLIMVAEDCPTPIAQIPPDRGAKRTVAKIHYALIGEEPYARTSDDVLFQTFAERKQLPESALEQERARFFSKPQPCLRTSPLGRRYGWGLHLDAWGRVALVAVESARYTELVRDEKVRKLRAMSTKRPTSGDACDR